MTVEARTSLQTVQRKLIPVLEAAIPVTRFAFTLRELLEQVLVIAEKRLGQAAQSESALTKFIQRLRLDDLYLAQACARGEEVAWEEFAQAHFAFIKAFARRSMPGSAEAEDLAQQIIADLWQRGKLGMYEGLSSLRTWLGAVIARAAVNALNRMKPSVFIQSDEPQGWERRHAVAPDEETSCRKLVVEAVNQAIANLPSEDKLLLLLYYEQGLRLREITVVYQVTKASLSRRLKALRQRIRDQVRAKLRRDFGLSLAAARELIEHMPADLDFDLKRVLEE